MPRVRMLRSTGGPDGGACLAGEVYDLPAGTASLWVASGRAVFVPDDAPADEPSAPVVSHQPAPKRRTR